MNPCVSPEMSDVPLDVSEQGYITCKELKIEEERLPVYKIREYSSSMDLAWKLASEGCFPEWSSVLVSRQNKGRGQFNREWISPEGNMYGSLRIPFFSGQCRSIVPLLIAGHVLDVLKPFGFSGEFKWPNDILVFRKKIGGILIEERSNILIVGIGINIVSAPDMNGLRPDSSYMAGALNDFGHICSPLSLWTKIVQCIYKTLPAMISTGNSGDHISYLEKRMAFIEEDVVFDSHDGKSFPAVVLGLDNSGGIRLKTASGETTRYTGSVSPKVC